MDVPTSTPHVPAAPASSASSRALMALIFGVLGVVCCGFFAPVAWYLGNEELTAIDAGRLPDTNRGMAQIGKILGIIGTILLGLMLVWVVFFGGLAFLSALGEMSRGY